MNTRPLDPRESANLLVLNQSGIDSVLLFVTETGLQKSILDATEPLRILLRNSGVHDFATQSKGQDSKVMVEAKVMAETGIKSVPTSLYRPTTKDGDPRLWFSRFREHANPDDVIAVFVHDGRIHALNLTTSSIAKRLDAGLDCPDIGLVQSIAARSNSAAMELLGLLRKIAENGPITAACTGTTAVGRSIETALGISINSSPQPDFKGIEIKSGRMTGGGGRENRATLFACVPDWDISALKASRAILDQYGYKRGEVLRLYCTVSTKGKNAQGLFLEVDEAEKLLRERAIVNNGTEVCAWRLDRLHERLQEKHKETFWIKASSTRVGGIEHFQLESAIHTARPSNGQFDRLLKDGTITLDHLVKRSASGRVVEKGPLFKVERMRVPELFLGNPKEYRLV